MGIRTSWGTGPLQFTDHGNYTEVLAIGPMGLYVAPHLDGHFDEAQFHVANDGAGHTTVTYGNSEFLLS